MVVLTACGKIEDVEEKDDKKQVKIEEEKKATEENVSSEKEILDDKDSQSTADVPIVQEPSNNASSDNNTTTKPTTGTNNTGSTTKPNTGSTGNTGSTNNSGNTGNTQNNSTSTTTQPSTPVHEHKWTEVKETVVVQEAWVEDVYGWRTICGKCGLDMTNMNGEDLVAHSALICKSGYSNKYIKIDEIQHPAVTDERVTGYKCSCGATKNK